jgi:hypothetical protein
MKDRNCYLSSVQALELDRVALLDAEEDCLDFGRGYNAIALPIIMYLLE